MRGVLAVRSSDQGDGVKPAALARSPRQACGRSERLGIGGTQMVRAVEGVGRQVVSPGRAARRLRRALIHKRSIRQTVR